MHDFNEKINRTNTNSFKYDNMANFFGSNDLIPLWVADTDFKTPEFITKAIKERAEHEIYGYTFRDEEHKSAISNWLKDRHNWKIEEEWLNFSPNVVSALASMILVYTNPGDKIIVQPPVYFPFFHAVKNNQRELIENPLKIVDSRYTFDFDDLIHKIDENTKMLLLCSPQNPGGMVWTRNELQRLGDICNKHDILIVSDEIHADLVFKNQKHIPIASLSEELSQSTITLMAPSKTFNMAGLSSSFVVIPNKELHLQYKNFVEAAHLASGNIFGIEATTAAYQHGMNWVNDLNDYLENNYNLVKTFFDSELPDFKVMPSQGTFLVWIDASATQLSDKEINDRFIKAGVALNPGSLFGTGGEKWIRMNIGCPKSLLTEGLKRIKKEWV